jgi:hypothetical protein
MKLALTIVTFFVFAIRLLQAQFPDTCKVTLAIKSTSIQEAFENLSANNHINFSYQSNLAGLQKIVNVQACMQPLTVVLDDILENSGLAYRIYAGQVVIFPVASVSTGKILLEGKLCKAGTKEPIPFAGIELKSAHKGTISDLAGYFRMEIEAGRMNDTIRISSLNFDPVKIPLKNFTIRGMHTFYLNERKIELPGIDVIGEKGKLQQWGNHRWFASGSFYLDTHGQQTALYIANEKQQTGNLVSVSFYLSKKGNTDAPFRVHIYSHDSASRKPGTDLLPEMVIIKPNQGKGWYKINLSRYRIILPPTGLYVAIEGIFPGEFDFFYNDTAQSPVQDNDDPSEFEGETISYGQQIGYSGGSENNTWHYSIDQTWFQLKKKHFNAMISAETKITKIRGRHGFLGLFGRNKN